MLLLVTTAHPSVHQHPDPDTGAAVHENLGRLLTPRHYSSVEKTAEAGIPWACDNDGFNGINEDKLMMMLDRIEGLPGCRFITAPDVVRCLHCRRTKDGYGGGGACVCDGVGIYGDAELTAARFDDWYELLAQVGQPIALVIQNGQREVGVPWDRIDAIFVGGDDDFKLGEEAAELAREAHARGKWVHWGRVNSRKRMKHILETGAADSCDGSSWARFRHTLLDKGLRWIRELTAAPSLPGMAIA
jgi:hypothetical protein